MSNRPKGLSSPRLRHIDGILHRGRLPRVILRCPSMLLAANNLMLANGCYPLHLDMPRSRAEEFTELVVWLRCTPEPVRSPVIDPLQLESLQCMLSKVDAKQCGIVLARYLSAAGISDWARDAGGRISRVAHVGDRSLTLVALAPSTLYPAARGPRCLHQQTLSILALHHDRASVTTLLFSPLVAPKIIASSLPTNPVPSSEASTLTLRIMPGV